MNQRPLSHYIFILICTIGLFSCHSDGHYQKIVYFKNHVWHHNNQQRFAFTIRDTACNYNIYFLIRHTLDYAYSNIWLAYDLTDPTGKQNLLQLETNLQNPDGTWLGRHFYNVVEQKMNITPNSTPLHFNKPGRYTVAFTQSMRDSLLQGVICAGLHVEKIVKQP